MEKLIGSLSISAAGELGDRQELIDEINRVVQPSQSVTADNVYLGLLQAASNEVNLQGGCFEITELTQLAQLIVDAPVMVGHKKQELPIGRVFKSEVVPRDGTPWLQAWFYWHRDQRDADTLKAGIESGIYKECSLGFLYGKPECCICREDMRHCRHRLNEVVRLGGREVRAFYFYKQIEKVLEVSLVYRGAVPNTRVSSLAADVDFTDSTDTFWRSRAEVFFDLAKLKTPLDEILIEPLYHGIWLDIDSRAGKLTATKLDGTCFTDPILDELTGSSGVADFRVLAQLIPVKGASRLSLETLREYSSGRKQPRCFLSLVDLYRLDGADLSRLSLIERKAILTKRFTRSQSIAPLAHYRCRFVDLQHKAASKGSGEGMRIIDLAGSDAPQVFEIRHQQQLRGKVVIEPQANGKSNYFVEFRTSIETETPTCHRLIGKTSHLHTGEIIVVHPDKHDRNRFVYLDLCIGDAYPDFASVATKLKPTNGDNRFRLLHDSRGDYWLELHHDDSVSVLRLRGRNPITLPVGHRQVCQQIDNSPHCERPSGRVALVDQGVINGLDQSTPNKIALELSGASLSGHYAIEQTHFGKRAIWLFGKLRRSMQHEQTV